MAISVDDLEGMVLGGRYRVTRLLGRGGMGAVHIARDEKLGSDVAVKVIREALLDDVTALTRFKREAQLLPELVHAHIVRAYGTGEDHGLLWIAMELLHGSTLRARIEERGRMPWRESLVIIRQIASALAAAHEKGVVHRDLKPDNVMILDGKPGEPGVPDVRLLDFGVAKGLILEGTSGSMTGTGMMVGTPGYIAPEVIIEGRSDDPRADLYALGVVWFELLTGSRPFSAKTPVALAMAHAHQPAPTPSSFLPFNPLPAPIEALVMRLMQKTPEQRPGSARELIALLETLEAQAQAAENAPTRVDPTQASFATVTDVRPTPTFTPGPMPAVLVATPTPAPGLPTTGLHVTPRVLFAGFGGAALVAAVLAIGAVRWMAEPGATAPSTPDAGAAPPLRHSEPGGAIDAIDHPDRSPSAGIVAVNDPVGLDESPGNGDAKTEPGQPTAGRPAEAQQAVPAAALPGRVKGERKTPPATEADAKTAEVVAPATGLLSVRVKPASVGASLYVDGKPMPELPLVDRELAVGVHELVLRVNGTSLPPTSVTIGPGNNKMFVLDGTTGKLTK